jgi:hypothetical protein
MSQRVYGQIGTCASPHSGISKGIPSLLVNVSLEQPKHASSAQGPGGRSNGIEETGAYPL